MSLTHRRDIMYRKYKSKSIRHIVPYIIRNALIFHRILLLPCISLVQTTFSVLFTRHCIVYIASTSQENYKTQQQQRCLFYMVMLSSYMVRLDTFFLLSLLCVYSVLQNRYFSFLASSAFLCVYPIFSIDPHSATQHYVCMYTAFPLLYNIDSIQLLM